MKTCNYCNQPICMCGGNDFEKETKSTSNIIYWEASPSKPKSRKSQQTGNKESCANILFDKSGCLLFGTFIAWMIFGIGTEKFFGTGVTVLVLVILGIIFILILGFIFANVSEHKIPR